MKKTKKVLAGISTTALAFGLSACGNEYTEPGQDWTDDSASQPIDQSLPETPSDDACGDWEWDADDGVWECDDETSGYYRNYFYGGRYFGSKSELLNNKEYQNYKNSSAFKGSQSKSGYQGTNNGTSANPAAEGSSGFGSGSESTGG